MILLEDLDVYKLANQISDEIWAIVDEWTYFQKDTLGKQFVRAADSISLNIAEGYGRYHYKENKNFCYYSRGSAYETLNCLKKAIRRGLINNNKQEDILKRLELFLKMLNGYIKTIGKMELQDLNQQSKS